MNELIHEIEEDIRRERMDQLWGRFGRAMVLVSVAIIFATVVVVVFRGHRQAVAMVSTAQIIKGLDRVTLEDYKGAIAAFSDVPKESTSYYDIALLHKAQAQQREKDTDGAAASYSELASHKGAFADFAKMLSTAGTIEPVKDSPFYDSQREWQGWQLLHAGKKEEAIKIFSALYKDDQAPYTMRGRMAEVLQYMAPDALAKADEMEK